MATIKTLQCDQPDCKRLRMNDTNHWWWGVTLTTMITVGLVGEKDMGLNEHEKLWKHFCGEQCMNRWFQQEVAKLGGTNANTSTTEIIEGDGSGEIGPIVTGP
jgi:hypothetical protein